MGFASCFFGAKFFWITIIVLLCIVFTLIIFIVYFIFQSIINFGGEDWIFLVLVGVGCLFGIAIGLCLKSMTSLFFIGIGGFLGYLLGLLLYDFILVWIKSNPTVIYWVTIAVCALICAYIGYKFLKGILIISTSLLGSYAVVKGISLYAGKFPSESLVIDYIKNKEWDSLKNLLTPVVYAYLGGLVLLFILSIYYQYSANKELTDDDIREGKRN